MLLSDHYQENLIGIVCDEVHKTPSWGMAKKGVKAFRECFGRLAELRSLCRNGIPVLALTASADVKTRKDIVHLLKLKKTTLYVEASPDRPNIRLSCVSVKGGDKSCLDWIVTGLREEGTSHPEIIIYCTSITVTRKVYEYIKKGLGDHAYVGPKQLSRYCLVAMFHNPTHAHKKEEVLACFAEGPVRVIVATTALSMGINFKDVRYVVNYGAPRIAEDMLQQIGRAGRDGLQSCGIVYHTSGDRCDDDVKAFVSCKTCLRANLYNLFEKKKATVPMLPGHICCSVCHLACCCNDDKSACIVPAPVFDKPRAPGTVPDDQPSLKRSVSDDEKQRLREGLFEYRQSLVQSKKLMFTLDMTTGFSADLIDCIIEHSPYIFDVEYIRKHIFLYDMKHADGIMAIVNKVFSEKLDMDDLLSFIQSEFCSEEADDDAERFYFWDCPFEDPPPSSSSNEESDDDDVE
ncbi:ATP-dependent DNA helicase RecQ-like [Branchiostoma lanceolatum]|uniref:ATP-dependent DNA helicase RecQ-like n=1 Tax=Branchiostoma lanceolatum TaxID=7740 RepID=UPI00345299DF